MATLRDYFTTDFPHYLNGAWDLRLMQREGGEITFPARVYFVFDAAVRFIALYLSERSFNVPSCRAVIDQWQLILVRQKKSWVDSGSGNLPSE
jgi:hypothetical protein